MHLFSSVCREMQEIICVYTKVIYFETKAKQKETKSNFGLQFTICVFQFTV